jgi:hypothetical protein
MQPSEDFALGMAHTACVSRRRTLRRAGESPLSIIFVSLPKRAGLQAMVLASATLIGKQGSTPVAFLAAPSPETYRCCNQPDTS